MNNIYERKTSEFKDYRSRPVDIDGTRYTLFEYLDEKTNEITCIEWFNHETNQIECRYGKDIKNNS